MAAGAGSSPAPKQFLELRGTPILIHTLRAFLDLPAIAGIFVAVRKPEIPRLEALLDAHRIATKVTIVEGGDTRQLSVANALAAIHGDDDDIVLVHDSVRPLIDAAVISRTIEAVERHGAAIVALPAVDTIKQVERTAHGAIITSTIPREYVVQAQTPQGFRLGLLKRAFREAAVDGFVGTDESSVAERAGIEVAVVPGTVENLKITQQSDLDLAEFFLTQREKGRG
ncbi:2-C-methyl-D-erythritol 4-phosphate cytidylyltransferase [Acidisarcina polymorpha]|uniref:2-C-methyl-D-erythritol 4-phosphate cytidylyltransferase n=2 Tax=Acidisarcina polymorpha TaxID=2211140 RepID=A0A2Z5G6N6_9BACT|nr:2-C-methyl-D-erythritol 4-phosphate cytidylyltransferase [Acidisarcina polymorpha]